MKKTITLPTANRTEYLKPMLSSLSKNNLTDYTLYINCEPFEEVVEICRKIDFIETDIIVNPVVLGVRQNPYNLLNRVFTKGESEFNIHIEDDLILSPDIIDLADWYCDNFYDNQLSYLAYGFFNYDSCTDDEETLISIPKFNGLGWSCFWNNWFSYFEKVWFDDELNKQVWGPRTYGWDWAVQALCKQFNYKTLVPTLSRSNHIGRLGGTHCSASFHDATFLSVPIADGWIKEYRIVD